MQPQRCQSGRQACDCRPEFPAHLFDQLCCHEQVREIEEPGDGAEYASTAMIVATARDRERVACRHHPELERPHDERRVEQLRSRPQRRRHQRVAPRARHIRAGVARHLTRELPGAFAVGEESALVSGGLSCGEPGVLLPLVLFAEDFVRDLTPAGEHEVFEKGLLDVAVVRTACPAARTTAPVAVDEGHVPRRHLARGCPQIVPYQVVQHDASPGLDAVQAEQRLTSQRRQELAAVFGFNVLAGEPEAEDSGLRNGSGPEKD